MIWVLVIPACLLVSTALVYFADRALREPEEPPAPPCAHPWFMDGRCVVCGHPR